MSPSKKERILQKIVPRQQSQGLVDTLWSIALSKEALLLLACCLTVFSLLKATATWWGTTPERLLAYLGGMRVESLFWGVLFFVLLAHLLERLFRLWGPTQLPLRAELQSWQRYHLLKDEGALTWDDVKEGVEASFGDVRMRGDVGWAERGRGALIGEIWVLGAVAISIGALGLSMFSPLPIPWSRVVMVMMPWLGFGLFMQMYEPYRCVAFWQEDDRTFLWGCSARGGLLLEEELEDIHEELLERV
ncbi:MAG TPA: hypothetical protein DCE42_25615 [Myxococcales bacterium]|nr:hypothetical protein [Deltaproteobacteria bacterium]MBU53864.1 hypothetical protein [Deltaproteobacteria bacterium]HAA58167.1 hypothetical protein [Myxococcales bacterium]|tara:strand:- start:5008 stop:5748 length:741 start_codon:yes stop_codon:yes gene_type:complete